MKALYSEAPCPFCKKMFPYASAAIHHLETGSCPLARQMSVRHIYEMARSRNANNVYFVRYPQYWSFDNEYTMNCNMYRCRLCFTDFASTHDFNRHLHSLHHAPKLYNCNNSSCKRAVREFSTLASLLEHYETQLFAAGHGLSQRLHVAVMRFLDGSTPLDIAFMDLANSEAAA